MQDKIDGVLQKTGNLEVTVCDSLKYWHKLIENLKPNEPWVDNCSTELLDGPVLMHELGNAQLNSVSEALFLRLSVSFFLYAM